jgi:short-subunit dehydrogenase
MSHEPERIYIGRTVLINSVRPYSAYAGSKAPVEHFTTAFAKEIGGARVSPWRSAVAGIRANMARKPSLSCRQSAAMSAAGIAFG